MAEWPDRRLLDLFRIEHPILQAPMANAMDAELAIAVAKAGGLGALPGGMLSVEKLCAQVEQFRSATANKPINLNFFTHKPPVPNNAREHTWREKLKPYYAEFGIDPSAPVPVTNRTPFNSETCAVVEELKPEVVSFTMACLRTAWSNASRRPAQRLSPPRQRSPRPGIWKRTVVTP